ncbi:hypothetical protein [uncultured Anaerococcus sp.]|uniref:hypothetical protein n=1 Tax=uncultured Anaerococcus sp. TaxID=293428 RepID=UPI0025F5685E|nr:hypothetical protein [uncultured Anaerococcus sp.]
MLEIDLIDNSGLDEIIKNLEDLEKYYVVIGITAKNDSKLIMIANVHEYGCDIPVTNKMRGFFAYNFDVHLKKDTKVIKIPERSFIRSGFDKHNQEFADYEDILMSVVDGNISAKTFYEIIGQGGADMMRGFLINEVKSPANSGFTIKNKGSSNPLVDTGRLVNAIDYEVRRT